MTRRAAFFLAAIFVVIAASVFTARKLTEKNGVQLKRGNQTETSLTGYANFPRPSGESNPNDAGVGNSLSSSINQSGSHVAVARGFVSKVMAPMFTENFHTLLNSPDGLLVDYALYMSSVVCPFNDTENALGFSANVARNQTGKYAIYFGTATLAQRQAAAIRTVNECDTRFGGGRFSDAQAKQARAKLWPVGSATKALSEGLDKTSEDNKWALRSAMTAPMLGVSSYLVDRVVDSDMDAQYGFYALMIQNNYGSPLILCALGEPCGPDSLLANRLCFETGVCNVSVQEGIRQHFQSNGLDWQRMDAYVNRVLSAFMRGDTSIFVRRK